MGTDTVVPSYLYPVFEAELERLASSLDEIHAIIEAICGTVPGVKVLQALHITRLAAINSVDAACELVAAGALGGLETVLRDNSPESPHAVVAAEILSWLAYHTQADMIAAIDGACIAPHMVRMVGSNDQCAVIAACDATAYVAQ